jgi:hypothetical protein
VLGPLPVREEKGPQVVGRAVRNICHEPGVVVPVDIDGVMVHFLVDTGSSVTILSEQVYAQIPEQSRPKLCEVFGRLRNAGLKLKCKICELFQKSVVYLRHVVPNQVVGTEPAKVEAVISWPTPTNFAEVCSLLGVCSYYRKFIEGFSVISRPLIQLNEKHVPFVWSVECSAAFEELHKRLEIITKLNDVTCRIRKIKHCEPKVVHDNCLKPYNGSSQS